MAVRDQQQVALRRQIFTALLEQSSTSEFIHNMLLMKGWIAQYQLRRRARIMREPIAMMELKAVRLLREYCGCIVPRRRDGKRRFITEHKIFGEALLHCYQADDAVAARQIHRRLDRLCKV